MFSFRFSAKRILSPIPKLHAPRFTLIPSLLLTFDLSPATARVKPAPLVRLTGKFCSRPPCRISSPAWAASGQKPRWRVAEAHNSSFRLQKPTVGGA